MANDSKELFGKDIYVGDLLELVADYRDMFQIPLFEDEEDIVTSSTIIPFKSNKKDDELTENELELIAAARSYFNKTEDI